MPPRFQVSNILKFSGFHPTFPVNYSFKQLTKIHLQQWYQNKSNILCIWTSDLCKADWCVCKNPSSCVNMYVPGHMIQAATYQRGKKTITGSIHLYPRTVEENASEVNGKCHRPGSTKETPWRSRFSDLVRLCWSSVNSSTIDFHTLSCCLLTSSWTVNISEQATQIRSMLSPACAKPARRCANPAKRWQLRGSPAKTGAGFTARRRNRDDGNALCLHP